MHNDRIIFGNNTLFIFKYPSFHKHEIEKRLIEEHEQKENLTEEDTEIFEYDLPGLILKAIQDEKEIDWEFAQREKMEKADVVRKEIQEKEDIVKQEERQRFTEEQEKMKLKQQEFEDKMRELGKIFA